MSVCSKGDDPPRPTLNAYLSKTDQVLKARGYDAYSPKLVESVFSEVRMQVSVYRRCHRIGKQPLDQALGFLPALFGRSPLAILFCFLAWHPREGYGKIVLR